MRLLLPSGQSDTRAKPVDAATGQSARPGCRFDLIEEEGASLQQVVAAFLVAERLLDLDKLWSEIEEDALPETVRIELFSIAAASVRAHIVGHPPRRRRRDRVASAVQPARTRRTQDLGGRDQADPGRSPNEAAARRDRLIALGASDEIVRRLVRLYELDGVFGIAALAARTSSTSSR